MASRKLSQVVDGHRRGHLTPLVSAHPIADHVNTCSGVHQECILIDLSDLSDVSHSVGDGSHIRDSSSIQTPFGMELSIAASTPKSTPTA